MKQQISESELTKPSGLIQINNKLSANEHKTFNFLLKITLKELFNIKHTTEREINESLKEIDEDMFIEVIENALNNKNTTFTTTFKDLKDLMNIRNNREVKTSLDSLLKTIIRTTEYTSTKKIRNINYTILTKWEYIKDEEEIEFRFNEELFETLKKFVSPNSLPFAKLDLAIQSRISGKHGLWLYEILKDYQGLGKQTFTIENLRDFAGIKKTQYKLTNNFLARVIEPAVKEINAKTDLKISIEKVKQGRTIKRITFTIKRESAEKILKEFMFRTFWTTILRDIEFGSKFEGGIRLKAIQKNGITMLLNCETNKPFTEIKSRAIYDYFYEKKEEFFILIKENNKRYKLGEDMNYELNYFFNDYEEYISPKIVKQFKTYTKNNKDVFGIWK